MLPYQPDNFDADHYHSRLLDPISWAMIHGMSDLLVGERLFFSIIFSFNFLCLLGGGLEVSFMDWASIVEGSRQGCFALIPPMFSGFWAGGESVTLRLTL